MLRLPLIQIGSRSWALPLSDAAATGLIEFLLIGTPQALPTALKQDPFFALWAVCQHPLRGQHVTTWDVVAEWLGENALKSLCLEEADFSSRYTEFERLANRRVQTLPSSGEHSVADLLVGWEELLESCGGALEADADDVPMTLLAAEPRLARQASRPSGNRWKPCGESGRVLAALVARLRRLQELEDRFDDSLEREKVSALKEFAYGASHEINNPLANISTRAQTLLREESDPEKRRKLATINSQAFRAHEMISDLMLFARPPGVHPERGDVSELIATVVAELAEDAEQQGTLISLANESPLTAVFDPVQLAVAVKAICRNSLEALRAGGQIRIDAARRETENTLVISVSDTGPGIPEEVRRHLFDPYFSGREAGRGLGLGLSKCWRIAEQHGGRVEVESDPETGTVFSIVLPNACPNIRTAG